MPGMSYELGRKLARELSEARAMIELRRLADGTFAPKGAGQILRRGDHVVVPHASVKGVSVPGVVKGVHLPNGKARIALSDGPDKGKEFVVRAHMPPPTHIQGPNGDDVERNDSELRYDRLAKLKPGDDGYDEELSKLPGVSPGRTTLPKDGAGALPPLPQKGPKGKPSPGAQAATHVTSMGMASPGIQSAPAKPNADAAKMATHATSMGMASPGVQGDKLDPKAPDPKTAATWATALGMASPGMQPSGKSLKDLPLGTTVTLADGNQYIVHKPVGDPWMILKPVDGGKAKPMHKMAPAVQADTSTAYDGQDQGTPQMSNDFGAISFGQGASANPAAHPDHVDMSGLPSSLKQPKPGASLADSPGRGPTGKLRNFKAMNKAKLLKTISDLQVHGGDPEALDAANAVAADKGFVKAPVASTPGPSSAAAALKEEPKAKPKQAFAKKEAAAKAKAGNGDLFDQLEKSVEIAKSAKAQGKKPSEPFKHADGSPGEKPAASGAENVAQNAALAAYQAAGGKDPAIIEMLKNAAKHTSKA